MNKMEKLSYHVDEIQNYLNSGFTNVQIAKIYDCYRNDIYKICKKFKLEKKYRIEHPDIDLNYFKYINTIEKAYWLGFLYADGYINKQKRFALALAIKDIDHVKKFTSTVGADINKIKIRYHNNKSKSISCSIVISKKQFSECLIQHGCVNKKSSIIRFPYKSLVSEKLKLAFIMGYYDGDGIAGTSSVCCGSKKFLDDIKQLFNLSSEIKKRKPNVELYELSLGMELKEKMTDVYHNGLIRKQGKLKFKYNKNLTHYNSRNQIKKFEISKQELNELINIKKLSYITIGKLFGVCDNSIKKRAKKLNIDLPIRNSRNKQKKVL